MDRNLPTHISAATMVRRLTRSFTEEAFLEFVQWRFDQADQPDDVEAIRRLMGIEMDPEIWTMVVAAAFKTQVSELDRDRRDSRIAKAIACSLVDLSKEENPSHVGMIRLLAIIISVYPEYTTGLIIEAIQMSKRTR